MFNLLSLFKKSNHPAGNNPNYPSNVANAVNNALGISNGIPGPSSDGNLKELNGQSNNVITGDNSKNGNSLTASNSIPKDCSHWFMKYPPLIGKIKTCIKCGILWAPGGIKAGERTVRVHGKGIAVTDGTVTFNEVDDGSSGTADTIDWTAGQKHKSTLTGNVTYTFTAPANPCNLILRLVQDATGSRLATWPSTVKWPGGTAPTLTTAASSVDIIAFYFDGTNYLGVASLDMK